MLLAKNRKANFDYEIVEKFTAGIFLRGYEVKALRERKVNMAGSYIKPTKDGLFVVGMHIGRYSSQSQKYKDEDSREPRKLLLTKPEERLIARALEEKGKTAVPIAVITKHGLIKLEIAIVKGRKKYEKKVLVKERQIRADLARESKQFKIPS